MNKELVRIEDLILVSCIMFDRFDSMDVSVLKQMISNDFELVVDDASDKYFVINDGSVIVENSYFDEIKSSIDMNLIKSVKKSNLYKHLKYINIIEFILRKIKLMDNGALPVTEVEYLFSHQVELLKNIYKENYITVYTYIDNNYNDDFIALKLTKSGDLYLYLIDNKENIDKFFNMLEELGCNKDIFNTFLLSQDLEKNINEILTINNFMDFCYEREVNLLSVDDIKTLKRVKK